VRGAAATEAAVTRAESQHLTHSGGAQDEDISITTHGLPVSETNGTDVEEKCLAALSMAIDRVNNMKKQAGASPEVNPVARVGCLCTGL
jgi:hypothetical protein